MTSPPKPWLLLMTDAMAMVIPFPWVGFLKATVGWSTLVNFSPPTSEAWKGPPFLFDPWDDCIFTYRSKPRTQLTSKFWAGQPYQKQGPFLLQSKQGAPFGFYRYTFTIKRSIIHVGKHTTVPWILWRSENFKLSQRWGQGFRPWFLGFHDKGLRFETEHLDFLRRKRRLV